MERLKKERTEVRKRLTRAKHELANAIQALKDNEQESYDTFRVSFTFFSQLAENLFEVDRRVQEQWLVVDGDEDEVDYVATDTYKKEWIKMELKCSRIINQREHTPSQEENMSVKSDGSIKRRMRLPKLELTKFDGNAKNWLGFWSSFKKIHNDVSIDEDDKMAYLIQSMTENSAAQNLVKSFPPCGENYAQAIEQLKSRYARDELLVEIYVRELLVLVLQQTKDNNSMSISALYDKLKNQLRALEVLGVTSEKYAAMLYPLVESALPAEILRVWERQRHDRESTDMLQSLLDFLKLEVESEERIQLTRQNFSTGETTVQQERIPTAACLVANNEPKYSSASTSSNRACIWCDKTTHGSHGCYKPQRMSLSARKELLAKKKGCTICLKPGHYSKKCKATTVCIICKKRHAVLLCPELDKPKVDTENTEHVLAVKNNGTTLLQTLLVKVGEETIRAFIDTGAQRSYIKRDVVSKLLLTPSGEETLKHCLFGGVKTKEETHQVYELLVKNVTGNYALNMTALSKERSIEKELQQHKINLTDIGDGTPEIDLLIGADYAGKIAGSTIKLKNELYAIKTKLGWALQGNVALNHDIVIATVGLTTDVSKLWDLEVIGIEEPTDKAVRKRSEEEATKEIKMNVTINNEVRYEVELPWRIDRPELSENRDLAEKRLRSTTKRLVSLNELENYKKVFAEWLELGIIEVEPDVDTPGHYLSHHAVIKESSLTTRVRPVFDASAVDNNGYSINDCLETGQNFLELIPILLTRFRMHAVGVTSDIKKAFLQISIAEKDRKYLRFLWWSDDGTIIIYRHCRVQQTDQQK